MKKPALGADIPAEEVWKRRALGAENDVKRQAGRAEKAEARVKQLLTGINETLRMMTAGYRDGHVHAWLEKVRDWSEPTPSVSTLTDQDRAELERPIEEVDAELRTMGVDPDELGKRGAAFVASLKEKNDEERRTHGVRRVSDGGAVASGVGQAHGGDAPAVEPSGERDDDLRRRPGAGVDPRPSEAQGPSCGECGATPTTDHFCKEHGREVNALLDSRDLRPNDAVDCPSCRGSGYEGIGRGGESDGDCSRCDGTGKVQRAKECPHGKHKTASCFDGACQRTDNAQVDPVILRYGLQTIADLAPDAWSRGAAQRTLAGSYISGESDPDLPRPETAENRVLAKMRSITGKIVLKDHIEIYDDEAKLFADWLEALLTGSTP